jgi:hypothetical protein
VLVWFLGLGAALFVALCVRQYRAQRGVYRPLTSRQPERQDTNEVPLGMEALDLGHIRATTRRNESLERGNTSWTTRKGKFLGGTADTDVAPLSDDETYAARYHAAFHNSKSKD